MRFETTSSGGRRWRRARLAAGATLIVLAGGVDPGFASLLPFDKASIWWLYRDGRGTSPVDVEQLSGPEALRWLASALPQDQHEVAVRGCYRNVRTQTVLTHLALTFAARSHDLIAVEATAVDGEHGSLTARGEIVAADGRLSRILIAIESHGAALVDRDDARAIVSGTLTYAGDETSGRLDGHLVAAPFEIRLLDKLPSAIVVRPVTETNVWRSRPGTAPAPSVSPPVRHVSVDLSVTADPMVVRGRGLDSAWTGTVRFTGSAAAPRAEGVLALQKGSITFGDHRFTLTAGSIRWTGDALDPFIDASAEVRDGDLDARLTVNGRANAPTITLSDDEDRPQTEILARLLFGTDNRLTRLQWQQLRQAQAQLDRGETPSIGTLSAIRSFLRLDDDELASPAPSASGNRPDVTLSPVRSDEDAKSLEADIAPGITIITTRPQGEEPIESGSAGIRWSRDY